MEYNQVYLLLSENCNLNCSYCFEHKKEKQNMSMKVLKDSLKFIENKPIKSIVLFGGEPTLNEEAILYCLENIKDKHVLIVTNGLYTSEKILNAVKNNDKAVVQVSIDGNYETMKDRVLNKEQFDQIIGNLKKYQSVCQKTCIHMTFTKSNIYSLYENFMFCANLGVKHITSTLNANDNYDKYDAQVYKCQLELINDYVVKEDRNIFFRPLRNNFKKGYDVRYCGAGGASITINSKGNIYACPRIYTNFNDRFKMGNIYEGLTKEYNFNLMKETTNEKNKCIKCDNTSCCVCVSANLEKYDNIVECNPGFCMMSKINKYINEKHEKMMAQNIKNEQTVDEAQKMYKENILVDKTRNIQLILTKRCNFNCKYCFSTHDNKDMDYDTLRKLIKFLNNKKLPKCNINFFGGEPMLKYNDLIVPFIKEIREHKFEGNFSIITNGTLLNKERIKYLIDNNVAIMISLDGDYKTFSKNRNSNVEFYNKIIENVKEILSYKYNNFEVRLTYREDDICNLAHNIEYLYNLGIKKVQIYHEYDIKLNEIHKKQLKYEFEKIMKFYVNKKDLNIFFMDRLLHYYFNKDQYTRKILSNCGCVNEDKFSFSMDYDGQFYTCHHFNSEHKFNEEFNMGNIVDGFNFEKIKSLSQDNLKNKYINEYNQREEKCKDCKLYNLCSANCIIQNLKLHDNIFINDEIACNINTIAYDVIEKMLGE